MLAEGVRQKMSGYPATRTWRTPPKLRFRSISFSRMETYFFNLSYTLCQKYFPTEMMLQICYLGHAIRDYSGYGLGQREKTLLCNVVSNWPSPYLKWSLTNELTTSRKLIWRARQVEWNTIESQVPMWCSYLSISQTLYLIPIPLKLSSRRA